MPKKWSNAETKITHELNEQSIASYKEKTVKKEPKKRAIEFDETELEAIRINTMTISKDLIKDIQHSYPEIFEKREALMFLYILGTTVHRCEKTGGIRFSRNRLAHLLQKHPDNVRLGKFLEEMKQTIPDLEWTQYEYLKGDCTVIINTGLDELLKKIATDMPNQRVFLKSMREANKRNKKAYAEQIKNILLKKKWKNNDAKMIAEYLLNIPYTYYEEAEKNFTKAMALAITLDTQLQETFAARQERENAMAFINQCDPKKIVGSTAEDHHQCMLFAVRDMWKPFYTEVENSPRIFGTEPTFLKTTLRKILWPSWVDFDLKNCQLVVVAHRFNLIQCLAFLDTGRSIWDYLFDYMDINENQYAIAKTFIKIAVYSIIFGMEKSDAQELLEYELACRGIFWKNRFTSSPLIQEVATGLKQAKKQIEIDGGMQGAYGWIALKKGMTPESVLACGVQSYEVFSIVVCFKLALQEKNNNNLTYDIMLHQHDGFSIRLRNNADLEKIRSNFQKAIKSQLKECYGMDIHMTIEYK